ncbi:MAG: rod shape-determining protein MreD, partial [Acidiferrobacteraceae bacterium]
MPRAATAGHTRIVVTVTLLLAIFLSIMPIPAPLLSYRPDWVALCLVYWSIEAPERVGMGTAWITGLAMDVLYGTLLGAQALADSVLVFIASGLRLRVRMFPRWQQALVVFA